MALAGRAVMMNWCNVAPEKQERFYAWHTHHHMLDRVGIAGFRRGRRFVRERADNDFFFIYEVDSISVFGSQDYLVRYNNPTPITRRNNDLIKGLRVLGESRRSLGIGQGGTILTLRLTVPEDALEGFDRFVEQEVVPKLVDAPRVLSVHYLGTDFFATQGHETPRDPRLPDRVLLLEGLAADPLEAAIEAHLGASALAAHRVDVGLLKGIYRHEVTVARTDAWTP